MDRDTVATPGSQPLAASTSPLPDSPIVAPAGVQPFPDPIPGVIPFGSLVVFGGLQRVGKTTLMGQWCAAWAAGAPILEHPTTVPVEIAYLAMDRNWRQYQELFSRFGLADLKHWALADDHTFPISEFTRNPLNALILALDRLNPAPGAVVFIDPIAPLFIQGNPNDARAVALSMHAFRKIARERQLTIICLVHFHKPKEDDKLARGIDQISGSGAFSGYSDVQMYLQHQQPGQEYQIFGWNPIALPAEDFQLQRNAQGLFELYTGESELDALLQPSLDRGRLVYDLIPEDTIVPTKDLEALAQSTLHLSRATLHRLLSKLATCGLIIRKRGSVTKRKPK